MNHIEIEFNKMIVEHESRLKKNPTTTRNVLQYLVDHQTKTWWWAWEFTGKTNSKGGYLSHKAPARLSDLALHAGFLEDRKIGRFKVYRLKLEILPDIMRYLNND